MIIAQPTQPLCTLNAIHHIIIIIIVILSSPILVSCWRQSTLALANADFFHCDACAPRAPDARTSPLALLCSALGCLGLH